MCLRLIRSNGNWLNNPCGRYLENGTHMVGSKYCIHKCPYYKGEHKIIFWNFIKCNNHFLN
jgi:hypothetical protein